MPVPTEDGTTKIGLADWNALVDLVNSLETLLAGKADPEDISAALSTLVTDAPTTLDTLGEIADHIASGDDVVTALIATVGTKATAADLTALTTTVTNHTSATTAHFSTASATPNRIAMRDANGKFLVGATLAADPAATAISKGYSDARTGRFRGPLAVSQHYYVQDTGTNAGSLYECVTENDAIAPLPTHTTGTVGNWKYLGPASAPVVVDYTVAPADASYTIVRAASGLWPGGSATVWPRGATYTDPNARTSRADLHFTLVAPVDTPPSGVLAGADFFERTA